MSWPCALFFINSEYSASMSVGTGMAPGGVSEEEARQGWGKGEAGAAQGRQAGVPRRLSSCATGSQCGQSKKGGRGQG